MRVSVQLLRGICLDRTPEILGKLLAASVITVASLGAGVGTAKAMPGQYFLAPVKASVPPSGANDLCRTYPWACTQGAGQIQQEDLQKVARVNRDVNRSVRDISDLRQFNRQEYWSLPTARGGDCEDIALLKKHTLINLGYPPQALLIATVLDHHRRGHAVLVVRTATGDLVLDNQTNRILPWAETGYVFLRMQDPVSPKRWVSLL